MFLLSEAIKYENNIFHNLPWHQKRIERAFKDNFQSNKPLDLEEILKKANQPDNKDLYKCRITYNCNNYNIEFIKYSFRKIEKLKIVFDNTIDYSHKWTDRKNLNKLYNNKDNADDIIIVKNGLLTDAFASNIVLVKSNERISPKEPLLPGVTREKLIEESFIKCKDIKVKDMHSFEYIHLINAMSEWSNSPKIKINNENIIGLSEFQK